MASRRSGNGRSRANAKTTIGVRYRLGVLAVWGYSGSLRGSHSQHEVPHEIALQDDLWLLLQEHHQGMPALAEVGEALSVGGLANPAAPNLLRRLNHLQDFHFLLGGADLIRSCGCHLCSGNRNVPFQAAEADVAVLAKVDAVLVARVEAVDLLGDHLADGLGLASLGGSAVGGSNGVAWYSME
eukprot:15593430-Heterocapsa_arctica.AAC.1